MTVSVTVEPETFTLVNYDAVEIGQLVAEVASWVGLGHGDTVLVKVDEASPLTMAILESADPIVLNVEGGAFEDLKKIRQLDPVLTQIAVARILARVADRRTAGFAEAPDEASVSIPELDCWDAWALGRAARHGLAVRPQPWLNRFRMRHGFTDVADEVFERLWTKPDVTWADIQAACAETEAAKGAVA
jgi:hypothetical protein